MKWWQNRKEINTYRLQHFEFTAILKIAIFWTKSCSKVCVMKFFEAASTAKCGIHKSTRTNYLIICPFSSSLKSVFSWKKNWSCFLQKIFPRLDKHTLWCGHYVTWKKNDVTIIWPFGDIFHRTKTVKIWTFNINEDNRILWSSICSLVEILCVLKEKISLNCWQLPHHVHAMEKFELNLPVNSLNFLSKWVHWLGIFTRNPFFWNSYLMPWKPII